MFHSPFDQPSYRAKPKKKRKKRPAKKTPARKKAKKKRAKKKVAKKRSVKKKAVRKKAAKKAPARKTTRAPAKKRTPLKSSAAKAAPARKHRPCVVWSAAEPDPAPRKLTTADRKVTHAWTGMDTPMRTWCGLQHGAGGKWWKTTKASHVPLVKVTHSHYKGAKITCKRCKELIKASKDQAANYRNAFWKAAGTAGPEAWPGDAKLVKKLVPHLRKGSRASDLWPSWKAFYTWVEEDQAPRAVVGLRRLCPKLPEGGAYAIARHIAWRAPNWMLYRQRGATNDELLREMSELFGISGGVGGGGSPYSISYWGGNSPHMELAKGIGGKPVLKLGGKKLVEAVRAMFDIPKCDLMFQSPFDQPSYRAKPKKKKAKKRVAKKPKARKKAPTKKKVAKKRVAKKKAKKAKPRKAKSKARAKVTHTRSGGITQAQFDQIGKLAGSQSTWELTDMIEGVVGQPHTPWHLTKAEAAKVIKHLKARPKKKTRVAKEKPRQKTKLSAAQEKKRAALFRKYPGYRTTVGDWPASGPYHFIAKGSPANYPQASSCGKKVGFGRSMVDPNKIRMVAFDVLVTCPKCKKELAAAKRSVKKRPTAKAAWGADLALCRKCDTYKPRGKKCEVCLSRSEAMSCPRGWYMEGDVCVHKDHQVGVVPGENNLTGAKEFLIVYRNTSGRGKVKWIGHKEFPTAKKAFAGARSLIKKRARLALPRPETIVVTGKQIDAMLKKGKDWIEHRGQDYWPVLLSKDQISTLVGAKKQAGARKARFVRADSSLDPRYGRGPGYVPRGPWSEAKKN